MTARVPRRHAGIPFILVAVFIDMLGMGLVFPVLPVLVGDFTASRSPTGSARSRSATG